MTGSSVANARSWAQPHAATRSLSHARPSVSTTSSAHTVAPGATACTTCAMAVPWPRSSSCPSSGASSTTPASAQPGSPADAQPSAAASAPLSNNTTWAPTPVKPCASAIGCPIASRPSWSAGR
jgi:hypothetical protein